MSAEYRDWARPPASRRIVMTGMHEDKGAGTALRLRWGGAGPNPRSRDSTRKVWFLGPDRLKVVALRGDEILREGVRDGARWWCWDRMEGAVNGPTVTEDGAWALPPLLGPPLLTPARLLGWLRFSDVRAGSRAGRAVLAASARPRRALPRTFGEVRYELEFDAEFGVMLRMAEYHGASCRELTEAVGVVYQRELDSSVFAWPPARLARTPGA